MKSSPANIREDSLLRLAEIAPDQKPALAFSRLLIGALDGKALRKDVVRRALAPGPGFLMRLFYVASLLKEGGHSAWARDHIAAALRGRQWAGSRKKASLRSRLLFVLGEACAGVGDAEGALSAFLRCRRYKLYSAALYYNLASIYQAIGKR
ncbi:MAG: hypothetical protein JXR83_12330, partial [Deltaproteobacteria bacterium]|nr:hypothetical protein [Deltaproteobacteria bacterium]